jgi:glutaredoxin
MSHGSSKHTLTSQDLATAQNVLEALHNSVVVKVIATRNPLSDLFRQFAADLASTSDKLQPLYLAYDEDGSPGIEIMPNLRYLALPNGRELLPFLQSLILCAQGKVSLSTRSLSTLESFITPTRVEVMISPACPYCPKVVSLVNQLALASTYLQVSIIDVTLFSEHAESHGIRAVPAVIIDEQDPLVGIISEELLVDRLVNSAVSAFHPETFKRILKEGDAIKLAGMMVADCDLYVGALELLADSDWSVRMGMMVVLEEVAESNAKLVQPAFPYLMDLLDREEANLRGDAAYLLGRIGDASTLNRLKEVVADENSEVAEAAREAIQQIREREGSGMG